MFFTWKIKAQALYSEKVRFCASDFLCFGYNIVQITAILLILYVVHFQYKNEFREILIIRRKRILKSLCFVYHCIFKQAVLISLIMAVILMVIGCILGDCEMLWHSLDSYPAALLGAESYVDIGLDTFKITALAAVQLFFTLMAVSAVYMVMMSCKWDFLGPILIFGVMGFEAAKRFGEPKIFFNYVALQIESLYIGMIRPVECILYPLVLFGILFAINCFIVLHKDAFRLK